MYIPYRSHESKEVDTAIAYLRDQIERDFENTFGYAPTWSRPAGTKE